MSCLQSGASCLMNVERVVRGRVCHGASCRLGELSYIQTMTESTKQHVVVCAFRCNQVANELVV